MQIKNRSYVFIKNEKHGPFFMQKEMASYYIKSSTSGMHMTRTRKKKVYEILIKFLLPVYFFKSSILFLDWIIKKKTNCL